MSYQYCKSYMATFQLYGGGRPYRCIPQQWGASDSKLTNLTTRPWMPLYHNKRRPHDYRHCIIRPYDLWPVKYYHDIEARHQRYACDTSSHDVEYFCLVISKCTIEWQNFDIDKPCNITTQLKSLWCPVQYVWHLYTNSSLT